MANPRLRHKSKLYEILCCSYTESVYVAAKSVEEAIEKFKADPNVSNDAVIKRVSETEMRLVG